MTLHGIDLWTAWLFVYLGLPLAWISVVLHLKTPWRKTELGKHLLAYAAVVAAVMSFAAIGYWSGRPFPEWLNIMRFGVYCSLIFVMGWRVWLQVGSVSKFWRKSRG